jgi:hypothetical protein
MRHGRSPEGDTIALMMSRSFIKKSGFVKLENPMNHLQNIGISDFWIANIKSIQGVFRLMRRPI